MPEVTLQQAFDLAVQHHQAGRLDEAETLFRQILAVEPRHTESLHHLGMIALQVGKHDLAVDLIRQAIALLPTYPSAHNNLGIALHGKGQLDEAITAFRQAITLQHAYPPALNNLGSCLRDKGQLDEAIACFRQALAFQSDYPDALSNLGNALGSKGQLEEAIVACRRAITLKPDFAAANFNLGNALKDNGQTDEAIAAYRQAIALKAIYPEAYSNLGVALGARGQLDEAIVAYRQALAFQSNLPETYNNLGNALTSKGQLDEAIAAFRHAIVLNPENPAAHSILVMTLNYHPGFDAAAIAEEQRRWNQLHAEPIRSFIEPHGNERAPERRLRIGYVSPDFRAHSVGYNMLPLFANHDLQDFETFCYAGGTRPDAITERFRACASHWRGTAGLTDAQLAAQVRADGIDILVDLSLHTADNRLPVFARKPAPVQVTFAGYPGSTGLTAIDYRLSDPYLDPAGTDESIYSEKTVRLPHSFWCYEPLDGRDVPVNRLPAQSNGFVTFGCLNTFCKVNDSVLRLWAGVLRVVPGSRLLLLAPEGSHRQQVLELLGQEGIVGERVEFVARQAQRKYLELYHRIDLGLDTLPYNGHTTSLDSLWMGVPVVTLVGETVVGRAGLCQLMNLGLPELIAWTPEDYVRIASELAGDLPRLAELRATLRGRMEQSPLMDAAGFARDIEAAYRQMWRAWCSQTQNEDDIGKGSAAPRRISPDPARTQGALPADHHEPMRIAFADFGRWDFHVQSVDDMPMGGSQSAACYLARAMVREGHEVFLISNTSSPGVHDGVTCLSWAHTDPAKLRALKLDVFVCILAAGNGVPLRQMLGPETLLILWNQHAHDQAGVQALADPRECAAYDAFAMVSDWQREQYHRCFGIDPEWMAVMRNAIAPAFTGLFSGDESILRPKTMPPVLAYTSTPFRGLDLLLDAFPQIRREVPGTTLRVFSSMKVYQSSAADDEKAYGALYERCRQMEGVEYVGSLPQPELARELRSVAVLAYPNTFAETSCIGVMEALAAGCCVVTSDLGALPETGADFARLIPVGRGREAYLDQFIAQTVQILREFSTPGSAMESELHRQVAHMNQECTWRVRAGQWTSWLGNLVKRRS